MSRSIAAIISGVASSRRSTRISSGSVGAVYASAAWARVGPQVPPQHDHGEDHEEPEQATEAAALGLLLVHTPEYRPQSATGPALIVVRASSGTARCSPAHQMRTRSSEGASSPRT